MLGTSKNAKSLYLGFFGVYFSTVFKIALGFQWYALQLWFKIAKFGFFPNYGEEGGCPNKLGHFPY